MREYSFHGLAGCVTQRRARQTGTLVGVYHGRQSGIDADPETPWVAVCEAHGSLIGNRTLKLAQASASHPEEWCEDCRRPTGANEEG